MELKLTPMIDKKTPKSTLRSMKYCTEFLNKENATNILLSALGVVVTGLASWGVAMLTKWLNTKIKDKQLGMFLTKITTIITDAVMAVYQEFVEVLKKNGKFDAAAQQEAKEKAIAIIEGQLTDDMRSFIQDNFGDIKAWISSKIEAVLYNLKN